MELWEDREFTTEELKEEEKVETRKKRISTESNIKFAKKPKLDPTKAIATTNLGEGGNALGALNGADADNVPTKPIPKACITKIGKYLKDIDAFILEFEGALAEASAPDVVDYISKKHREKHQLTLDLLKANVIDAKKFAAQKTVPKTSLKEIPGVIALYVQCKATATEALDQIHEALHDAQQDLAPAQAVKAAVPVKAVKAAPVEAVKAGAAGA